MATSTGDLIRNLVPVAQGIIALFGDTAAEVVIHDLSDPERSIVSIHGDVTGRRVGGSITDLGLELLHRGGEQTVFTYESLSPRGHRMRSTTVFFLNRTGAPSAALCINIDLEPGEVRTVSTPAENPNQEHYDDDPNVIVKRMLDREMARRRVSSEDLDPELRRVLTLALHERGVFHFRNAPRIVADLLGVSRFTIYNYLNADPSRTRIKSRT